MPSRFLWDVWHGHGQLCPSPSPRVGLRMPLWAPSNPAGRDRLVRVDKHPHCPAVRRQWVLSPFKEHPPPCISSCPSCPLFPPSFSTALRLLSEKICEDGAVQGRDTLVPTQHPWLSRAAASQGFHLASRSLCAEERPSPRTPSPQGHPRIPPRQCGKWLSRPREAGSRQKAWLRRPDNVRGYFQLRVCLPYRKVNWLLLIFQ